jgi:septal ring factor EnvC (AmiA/AmiB activator)
MRKRVRSDVVYSPELTGGDARVVAGREFLKLQAVIAELAESIASLSARIENVSGAVSENDDAIAQGNGRIDALEALTEEHSGRLEALENPE